VSRITPELISSLANTEGADKATVEGFLMGLSISVPVSVHILQVAQGAINYGWSRETCNAIVAGLKVAYEVAK
jgi:hypothetical protein